MDRLEMIASAEGHIPPGTVHAGVNVKGMIAGCLASRDYYRVVV